MNYYRNKDYGIIHTVGIVVYEK